MPDPLSGPHDVEYWRALEERSAGDGTRARSDEFPADAALAPSELSRRDFVKLLGASAALAGLGACARPPADQILPYADRPPEVTPGIPRYYATSMVLDGYATGLLVASREGRPVKVEGNPRHPASLGAAGVYQQASVLQLYDPHRGRTLLHRGQPESWATLLATLGQQPQSGVAPTGTGEGLAFLIEPTGSPLLLALLAAVRTRYPAARVFFHGSPSDAALAGARLAYGRPLQTQYDFSRAATVVALDANFLASTPYHLRYAHDFAERRRIRGHEDAMNRLYAAEPVPTPTGALADHRLRVRASEVEPLAAALLASLGGGSTAAGLSPAAQAWVAAAAEDLAASRGASAVIAGDRQPAAVHALVPRINQAAGNLGSTVTTREPVLVGTGADEAGAGLAALVQALQAGQITTLLIFEGNPVYTAPADLALAELLKKASQSVYLGLYPDETAAACSWYVPARHYLEQWGDAVAYDGTLSLIQPLVQPLYPASRSPADLLALYAGRGDLTPYDLLRETWGTRVPGADLEGVWNEALRTGVVPAGAAAPSQPTLTNQGATPAQALTRRPESRHPLPQAGEGNTAEAALASASPAAGALELVFPLDQTVHDGRFANLSWLQELPEPISKLTWDNAALLSPATAKRLGVESGEMVELRHGGRALRAPALVLPGVADEVVALHLGYGRSAAAEPVARGVGVNANLLRTTATPYFAPGAELARAKSSGGAPLRHPLA
ncbi:MAG TPA: TAT-variant-translocated molybdopterin oxidoreductase, partial [Longimicrobiaceae bacterium]|nr:TAT-variant-translocated molybdopterin oxidoreductase [Longimicrobiaceae bacterium]